MASEQKYSKLEAMLADLCVSMKRVEQKMNQMCDDQSTLDRSTTPSVKVKGNGSDHCEKYDDDRRFGGDDRRFGGGQFREGADDDDDALPYSSQLSDSPAIRSKQLDELLLWLRSNNAKRENRQVDAELEEESMPQFQVPVSDLEHGLRIHNVSSIVCEDSQYIVGCEELCDHQKSILQVSYVKESEEIPQKSTSGNDEHVAHQLFDQKPNKEKHMKHLKAWKFKFKSTSKRSKLMDSKLSFVDATVLLNKDSLETIWDCVKKEFEETMAACEKNIVDWFKLAEERESRLQVLDLNQTFMHHQRSTSLTIRDCPDRASRANRVWKPGGLLCVQDHCGGSILMVTQPFHGLHLQGIMYMDMKFQEVIVDDVLSVMVCLCVPNKKFEAGLEIYGCETKKQMLLIVKLANRVWERGKLLATHVYSKWSCQDPAIFQPILRFLMNTKQPCLSLRANRVWDPGGSNSEKKKED